MSIRRDYFFVPSYDSIVLVWITTEVSPRWRYCASLVITRVTLQDESPTAAPMAVSAAIVAAMMIFEIRFICACVILKVYNCTTLIEKCAAKVQK